MQHSNPILAPPAPIGPIHHTVSGHYWWVGGVRMHACTDETELYTIRGHRMKTSHPIEAWKPHDNNTLQCQTTGLRYTCIPAVSSHQMLQKSSSRYVCVCVCECMHALRGTHTMPEWVHSVYVCVSVHTRVLTSTLLQYHVIETMSLTVVFPCLTYV